MAGDIEEPFMLNFQADSFHSGSISFGRFETEALCWERRSSFSHNRYLEEVEKCSKPGSVIEKKAYFEAHFRKKGLLGLNSPNSQNDKEYQTSENDNSEKASYDDEINNMNYENQSPCFDEETNDSVSREEHAEMKCDRELFGTPISVTQIEVSYDTDDTVSTIENVELEEADHEKLGELLSSNSIPGIERKENFDGDTASIHTLDTEDCSLPDNHSTKESSYMSATHQEDSSPKEHVLSEAECTKPKMSPQLNVAQTRRYISNKESDGLKHNPTKKVNNVVQRSITETRATVAVARKKGQTQRTPKQEPGSKPKAVDGVKSTGKESRNRITVSQSSQMPKVVGRPNQSVNRIKPVVAVTKQVTKPEGSMFSFKGEVSEQRRKEFNMKSEVKMHTEQAKVPQNRVRTQVKKAENKQLRESSNFKATPMPSFYHGALRESDRNKAVTNSEKPRKLQNNPSSAKIRVSGRASLSSEQGKKQVVSGRGTAKVADLPQASGATSCHSTVTSDSNPSSPAAKTSNTDCPRAGKINSLVRGTKENEKAKCTNVTRRGKVQEVNQLNNRKTTDRKQNTRSGGRITTLYTAFKK